MKQDRPTEFTKGTNMAKAKAPKSPPPPSSKYPMSRKEYRAALAEFDLTQPRAAWLFNGKSDRSGRRWATEGAPYHVALIIALMQEFELTPEHIEALGRKWRKKAA